MFETIATVLIVLWLLGVVAGYTMEGLVYVLLVLAVLFFGLGLIAGRRRV